MAWVLGEGQLWPNVRVLCKTGIYKLGVACVVFICSIM